MVSEQLLANFDFMVILALGVISAPSLQAETEPEVDSGMPYGLLKRKLVLVLVPYDLLLPPINTLFCQGCN
jgi:hypothetical protein